MFDLQKLNALLGTNFASIDEITEHQLLAALVTLTAASLGVEIFVCNPTTGAVDGACTCAKVRFYPDENVVAEDCPVHNPHRH
jgi:hypothetical protein